MAYKTINVSPETYEKLLLYKHAGMSFDDVINKMMNLMPEEEFYRYVLEEHRRRMRKIRGGEIISAEDLDNPLKSV